MTITIGVLRCDEVKSCWRDEHGELDEMIQTGFIEAGKDVVKDWRFKTFDVYKNELPEDIDSIDAFIITGCRYGVSDDLPWMATLYAFIVRLHKEKKAFIGLSFGHHAVATALGGKVERNDCGWLIGVHDFDIDKTALGLKDVPKSELSIIMMNQDSVVTLPKDARSIAKTKRCEHAIIGYGEHGLTLQGHPEFSIKFTEKTLTMAKDHIPSVRYEAGLLSLKEKKPEKTRVFLWFIRLIERSVAHRDPAETVEITT